MKNTKNFELIQVSKLSKLPRKKEENKKIWEKLWNSPLPKKKLLKGSKNF